MIRNIKLIILGLSVLLMSTGWTFDNATSYSVTKYESVLEALKISDNANIVIANFPTKRIKLYDNIDAFTVSYRKDQYVIFIKEDLTNHEIKRIITHELCHVRQIQDGRLVATGNVTTWNGDTYKVDDQRLSLPWEIDARKMDRALRRTMRQTDN